MNRSTAAYKAASTRRSNDQAVRDNLPPELVPLFNRIGRGLRGSPDRRAEDLQEYAESHPREALAALVDAADDKLEALIRERAANDNEREGR